MSKDHNAVAELAYTLWQQRGSPDGSSDIDWIAAERQLAVRANDDDVLDESLEDTFPASDPPASALPDVVPVNAGKKRRAAGLDN